MAGKRKTERNLSGSWADVSSGDDLSEGGESVEMPESEDEQGVPAQPIEAVDPNMGSTAFATSTPRRKTRAMSKSLDPAANSPRVPLSASSRRKSPRVAQSPTESVEPEFIMPSMMASGSVKGTPARTSPLTGSTRARKVHSLANSRATPSRAAKNSAKVESPKIPKRTNAPQGKPILTEIWSQIIRPILWYLLGVFGHAMIWLKPLFGVLLAIFAIFYGLKFAFKTSLGALSILPGLPNLVPSPCSVPIINMLPMCTSGHPSVGNPEFEDLMKVQSSFEDILQSTAYGSVLPLEMKKSEASVRDLKYVVTYSNLPSRHELVFEFQGFIDTAKQAANDLTKFNSRVGRAVDHIISTNKHTLQVIDGFIDSEASRGMLSKYFFGASLTQDHLHRQYLQHTDNVEEEIQRLIVEAQVLLQILENLDSRLDVIHDVVTRDGVNVRDSREELFAQLWTKLGGNRDTMQKLNNQMNLLKSVNTYRRAAWQHVTSTLLKLQEISAGLEDLRERVAMPEVLGIETIPLTQHIETIQMGVERLEKVRENSRSIEGEGQRRVLDAEGPNVGRDRMVEAQAKFSV